MREPLSMMSGKSSRVFNAQITTIQGIIPARAKKRTPLLLQEEGFYV